VPRFDLCLYATTDSRQLSQAGRTFQTGRPAKRAFGRFENVSSLRRFSQILDQPAGTAEAMKGFGGSQN
jgi:hypothetical protein